MTRTQTPCVAFVTLGCPKNEVDTGRMQAAVMNSAYRLTDDLELANVVVLNTCSFIREATEESIAAVMDYAHHWVPAGDDRRLIVAGCMPSRYGAELREALAEPDAFVPVSEQDDILEVIALLTGVGHEPRGSGTHITDTPVPRSSPSSYLMISDGCDRRCTYCTIPSIRGPYRSRSLEEILTEAQGLVSTGSKELILIGQDITSYGRDLSDGVDLARVVTELSSIDGLAWIRLMYAQPQGITDALLKTMADHSNVVEYLDMPLQHASASVLRAMDRSGDGTTYLELLKRIRHFLPNAFLRTTLIAGFPGESHPDAKELESFVSAASFDYVGVFPYSREEGTPAASLESQVPARTRRARTQRLRDLADTISLERVAGLVDSTLEVLVEGFSEEEGAIIGRHRGQAPEIDGIVILDRGHPGDIVNARVIDVSGYDLEAEVL